MAGEITRIWPGGRPGPWRTFADKDTDPRILSLYITEAPDTALLMLNAAMPRDDTQITKLRPKGVSPVYTIADKELSGDDVKVFSDTYRPILTFGDFGDVDVIWTDTYRPIFTLSMATRAVVASSDTYRPVLAFGMSVVRAGVVVVPCTDTYRPVLTLSTAMQVQQAIAHTYVPVLTFGNVVLGDDIKAAAHTYVPVLTIAATSIPWTTTLVQVSDTYSPSLTFSLVAIPAGGDVDGASVASRPYYSATVKQR